MHNVPRPSDFRNLPSDSKRRLLAVVLCLLLVAAIPAAAQDGRTLERFSGRAQVTAVDLVISVTDRSGAVPTDLTPADFEVIEDGEVQRVIGVDPFRSRPAKSVKSATTAETRSERPPAAADPNWNWQTVVYFDQVLSSSRSIRRAAGALAAQAGQLTELGPVQVIVANSRTEEVLAPTRSARLVEQTLERLSRELSGRDELRRHRKQFLHQVQFGGLTSVSSTLVRGLIQEEELMLRRQHDVLLSWAADFLEEGPRALMLVNDGYDLDPREFYSSNIDASFQNDRLGGSNTVWLNVDMGSSSSAPKLRDLAQFLAARGWTSVNLALGALNSGGSMSAEMSGRGRSGDLDLRASTEVTAPMASSLVYRPLDPMRQMADATGGETLTGIKKLPQALQRLESRVRLTYQVSRRADGKLHPVEVRALRPGLKVQAPRWSGSSSPEGLASSRARRLLAGGVERGDLPVEAAVATPESTGADDSKKDPVPSKLQARVDLEALKQGASNLSGAAVRVTLAASFSQGVPFVHHQELPPQDLQNLDLWTFSSSLALPPATEKVAVVFEELGTGTWGGALAARVTGDLPTLTEVAGRRSGGATGDVGGATETLAGAEGTVPLDLLPDRKAIVLLPPSAAVVQGRERLEALVSGAEVERVDFLLDGRKVESRRRSPFEARIDFGSLPQPREVLAVAFDGSGAEVGRDRILVNQGVGTLKVDIIEPRDTRQVGPVDVEAEVDLPTGAEIERVEIRWNDQSIATLFEPPFRQRLRVPPDSPVGYLQVVAHLSDGQRAEDVLLLNGDGLSEQVDVKLVELYTVVADEGSRPVRGLERSEFDVYEDEVEQEIADFRQGSDVPISLALLLDTSASMFPAMRDVKTAAIDFLSIALRGEDRAMVVEFSEKPQIVQTLTDDRQELYAAVAGLQAGGRSALCDALVYTLLQMQSIAGRRAVVVLTDGVGRDERVGFDVCRRVVEKSGIPLYTVLLAGDDPTTIASGGFDREKVETLVEPVGGRVLAAED
ncbi:MAG: VWA domain-containing protein, partial [Acidobacteriota bacterium]